MLTRNYHSDCHRKYILQAYVILSCKYRKKLIIKLGDSVKQIIMDVANSHGFNICTMEVDKDHLHILIGYSLSWALKDLISLIKQMTTYHIWHSYDCNIFKKSFLEG